MSTSLDFKIILVKTDRMSAVEADDEEVIMVEMNPVVEIEEEVASVTHHAITGIQADGNHPADDRIQGQREDGHR